MGGDLNGLRRLLLRDLVSMALPLVCDPYLDPLLSSAP